MKQESRKFGEAIRGFGMYKMHKQNANAKKAYAGVLVIVSLAFAS
jgi:hypothetical protein